MRVWCSVAAAVAAAGCVVPASGQVVLGSVDLFWGFAAETTEPSLLMGFGVIADNETSLPEYRLFAVDQVLISAADVGTTWTAPADVTAQIRAHLGDDDLDDALGFYAYLGGDMGIAGRVMEGDLLNDLDMGLISQQADELRVTLLMWNPQPASQPGWTSFLFRVRYEFVSTVPAPGAGALLGAAGVLAARRRR